MRFLLLMLGIGVYVVGFGTRAEAQNYPWCGVLWRQGGGRHELRLCHLSTVSRHGERDRRLLQRQYTIPSSTRAASADEASKALSLLAYGFRSSSGSLAMFAAILA